jgi:hypothetical protein
MNQYKLNPYFNEALARLGIPTGSVVGILGHETSTVAQVTERKSNPMATNVEQMSQPRRVSITFVHTIDVVRG